MKHFVNRLGWVLLVIGAVLILLGIAAWPPGGLMFALPYLFLLPGVPLAVIGGVVVLLSRRLLAPGKIEVVNKFRSYEKGDIIWVYTYLGEGFFKVWVAGKMYEEEIPFLLHGEGGGWAICAEEGTCWGKVIAKPRTYSSSPCSFILRSPIFTRTRVP